MNGPLIRPVATLDVRCVDRAWPWADANEAKIAAFWADAKTKQPKLFDGPVYMFAETRVEEDTCRAVCFETRFSRLLYAKAHGFPDRTVVNGFAMGALRATDGAFLLGVMGDETANRGQVYFPAGTPDPSDREPGGRLDLTGSVIRELAEETGLRRGDYHIENGWILVEDGGLFAFLRPVRLPQPAADARLRILERMKHLREQELSDIYVARSMDDIDPGRMPAFIQAFLRWTFLKT